MRSPEITQKNVRLLLPGKIAAVAVKIRDEKNCSDKEALLEFYNSELYRELECEETKRWWESPAQLYADFTINENNKGNF
ncbi:MAG: hypothetical protein LBP59_20365 [Planctomycetaceae bacterium]|jgi:hypothetical protein|nr:hypothetical protein [Planctomycetaceae bacterium]